jgi:putative protease
MRSEQPTQLFIGLVESYDPETGIATIGQRNYFEVGQDVEMFSPDGTVKPFKIESMTDVDGTDTPVARHPKQILKIKVPFPVVPYAMMRKR